MTKKIVVAEEKNRFKYCEELENGNILFFQKPPFPFPQEEIDFLLRQKITAEQLREILRNYSHRVTEFLSALLSPYARGWKRDYARFCPFQENDLLHVDSFPTRPMHGSRILRFFTNVNPKENRVWITSKGFAELAQEFIGHVPPLKTMRYDLRSRLTRKWQHMAQSLGLKGQTRSPYDHFMLQMHHFLKENSAFQKECPKDRWEFPPMSCWAVFTDQVSHAALSGQYVLEQTFIVPQQVLLCPEKSPVCVLERLSGKNLVDLELLSQMFVEK